LAVILLALFMGLVSSLRYSDLQAIPALAILGGAIPLGVLFGFFKAGRISRKCDTTGVYSPKSPSARVLLMTVAAIFLAVSVFSVLILYRGIFMGVDIPLPSLAASIVAILGLESSGPIGTILFEYRAGVRLWILATPSLWFPSRIAFQRVAVGASTRAA
jgi:hypothetical protein